MDAFIRREKINEIMSLIDKIREIQDSMEFDSVLESYIAEHNDLDRLNQKYYDYLMEVNSKMILKKR